LNAIQALSQLSYGPGFVQARNLTQTHDFKKGLPVEPAGPTGLEPATSGVTVRHSNRLSYGPVLPDLSGVPPPAHLRAGNRTRTGDLNLGKVALYQLSYARASLPALRPALPRGVEPRSQP
jgi:hypothetical protein